MASEFEAKTRSLDVPHDERLDLIDISRTFSARAKQAIERYLLVQNTRLDAYIQQHQHSYDPSLFHVAESDYELVGRSSALCDDTDILILKVLRNNPTHVLSDIGRNDTLSINVREHGLSLSNLPPDELCVLLKLVYPLRQFRVELQVNAALPEFMSQIWDLYQPASYDMWLHTLWLYVDCAAELFADVLYLARAVHDPGLPAVARAVYEGMLTSAFDFTEFSAVAVTKSLVPFARVHASVRQHADAIASMAEGLSPSAVGLIIRSLIMGFVQPYECKCGYAAYSTHCSCVLLNIADNPFPHGSARGNSWNKRARSIANDIDSARVYVVLLLELLLHALDTPDVLSYHKKWTDDMRNELIVSACDVVFTVPTYLTIYKTINKGRSDVTPKKQKKPRATPPDEDFRNAGNDYENSHAQTGTCIVANCNQSHKVHCTNMSCKTHCNNHRNPCQVHRHYPEPKPYYPRLYVNLCIDGRGEPLARDADDI